MDSSGGSKIAKDGFNNEKDIAKNSLIGKKMMRLKLGLKQWDMI